MPRPSVSPSIVDTGSWQGWNDQQNVPTISEEMGNIHPTPFYGKNSFGIFYMKHVCSSSMIDMPLNRSGHMVPNMGPNILSFLRSYHQTYFDPKH